MNKPISKPRVLISFDTVREGFDALLDFAEVTRKPHGESYTREELLSVGSNYDVLASHFTFTIDREIIDAFPNLKLIANYGVGFNNIDIAYAQSKGIAVTNTPQGVIRPTAELTMGLLLSCTRKIGMWDRLMRRNRSSEKSSSDPRSMGTDLYGKSIGIIGYGNIGRAVGHMAQAFGMKVYYNKRSRLSPTEEAKLDVHYASTDEIFAQCDVVSLHTPYTPETHHLVCKRTLSLMQPTAILLNASRGAVVDEQALIKALQIGQIAGAGLDVFEHSDNPLPELYDMEQVTITPHVGTQTYEARVSMVRELCNYIIGFYLEDRPVSFVTPR